MTKKKFEKITLKQVATLAILIFMSTAVSNFFTITIRVLFDTLKLNTVVFWLGNLEPYIGLFLAAFVLRILNRTYKILK